MINPIRLVVLLSFLLFVSCSSESKNSPQSGNGGRLLTGGGDLFDIPAPMPVTEAEAQQFAKAWSAACQSGNGTTGSSLVSFESILNRSLANVPISQSQKLSFVEGVKSGGDPVARIINNFHSDSENFEFLRVRKRGSHHHAVFRGLGSHGELFYVDFRVVQLGGQVCADSIHNLLQVQSMSSSLRSGAEKMVILDAVNKRQVEAIERNRKKDMSNKLKFLELVPTDPDKAIQIFESMKAEARSEQMLLGYRTMLATQEGSERFKDYLLQYERRFPDDPGLALLLFDMVAELDPKLSQEFIARLEQWTGGDNYLMAFASDVFSWIERKDIAAKYYDRMDRDSISWEETHNHALSASLGMKNHGNVLFHLKKLRDEFEVEFDDLTTVPEFEEFVKSPEYSVWKEDN